MSNELVPTERKLLPEVVDESGNKITGPELEAVTGMVTQLAQLAQLARIRKTLEKQAEQMYRSAPVGKIREFEKTVSGSDIERWEVDDDLDDNKGVSCTIYNNGDDSVWVALNDAREHFGEIKANESKDFDFHGKPTIERFFWYTVAGGEATLRIPMEY